MNNKLREVFNRYILPVAVAGAIVFGTMGAGGSTLEQKVSQEAKQEARQQALTQAQETKDEYSYLDAYNNFIDKDLAYFSSTTGLKDLERNTVKAMISVEAGHNNEAFSHDPMQIANKGDYALKTLAGRKECSYLIGDFSCLKDNKETPRGSKTVTKHKVKKTVQERVGFWDYSDSNMTAEESIYGGIGWLLHKRAIYETKTFEEGDLLRYTVKKGDSFSKIAGKVGTTTRTIENYNPGVNSKSLKIGQKIQYRKARNESVITGWRETDKAIERYNGGGDSNYLEKVEAAKAELDKRDKGEK